MKQIALPSHHYAASWKTEGVFKTIPEINDLGRRYAELPAGNPDKEAFLLELCQCFHPYLMKYLIMICRGHVPVSGGGNQRCHVNKDIKPFLLYFLPKGQQLDWQTMNRVVKGFHLAFKGVETDEIYDILMAHLVATIKGYDPTYTDKVKLLVEVIENELSKREQFSFADANRHLDFDCNRYIRLLGRLGFVCSAPQRPAWSIKEVHRPSAASRNASKSLAAAFDSSNSFANKFSALQKSNAQAVRPQLDSFRKVTQRHSPTAGSTGMTSFR